MIFGKPFNRQILNANIRYAAFEKNSPRLRTLRLLLHSHLLLILECAPNRSLLSAGNIHY